MCQTIRSSLIKGRRTVLPLFFAVAIFTVSARAQAVFSNLQSGSVLKPKQLEVTPDFSAVVILSEDEGLEHVWNTFGVQLGVGIAKRLEIRVRYAYLDRTDGYTTNSIISFGPKIGLAKNILSFYLPVEFKLSGGDVESMDTSNIQPTLMLSAPVGKRFEINPAVKVSIPFHAAKIGSPYEHTQVAADLGFGIFLGHSRNLVIRPEAGVIFAGGGDFWQFSVGFGVRTKN